MKIMTPHNPIIWLLALVFFSSAMQQKKSVKKEKWYRFFLFEMRLSVGLFRSKITFESTDRIGRVHVRDGRVTSA
jgi:hypothetical protein